MSQDPLPTTKDIIERVEQLLQAAYKERPEFNEALNGSDPVEIKSLIPGQDPHQLVASEILFWTDRKAYTDELEFWKPRRAVELHQDAIKYLRDNDQEAVFHDLVTAIKKNRVAPFIGAGMSQACEFPLWGSALDMLSKKITGVDPKVFQSSMAARDYLKAAKLLWDSDSTRVKNFIRTKFAQQTIKGGEVRGPIKLLPRISHGCLITTNFDSVIELVVGKGSLEGYMHGMQQGNKFVPKLIKGDRCILKLHGDAEDHDTYVFTEDQYAQAYGSPEFDFTKPLPRALRQIFVSHSLLFLGCSLEQDRTLELFQKVCNDRQFEIPDHYAIIPLPVDPTEKNNKEGRLLNLRIRPIWYPIVNNTHELVEKYLTLAVEMAEGRITSF